MALQGDREGAVVSAFVSIAEALAEDYDIVDLYTSLTGICVQLLEVDWAGLLLLDPTGSLRVAAASSEHAHNLELFQLQCEQGPCVDCASSGEVVSVPDLAAESERWPRFAPTAVQAGFASVHAVPMRWHSQVLGALGLFRNRAGPLEDGDLLLGRSLANVACVALITARAAQDGRTLNAQLQHALESRVVLEQAKGFLAQYAGIDVNRSFALMRRFSRDRNLRLTDVASGLLDRSLAPDTVLAHAQKQNLGR